MNSITFCGSIITDVIKTLPAWPEKGMLVPIQSIARQVGGSVCNTGIDLKTLDPTLAVRALGAVGDDDNGAFAVRTLEDRGLDCSLVRRVKGVPTSFTDVMTLATTGERTFFNLHGADSTLTPDDIDVRTLGSELFHFGYLLLLDGMDAPDVEYGTKAARLLAKVQAAGIKTSIDIVSEQSDRFQRIVRPALKYTDYCIINEVEGSMATGVPKDDLKGVCEQLFALGVKERVVVHEPKRGVTLGKDGDYVEVPSLKLPSGWIKGSVGAGDAFCAGALYAIMKGFDPEKLLRVGSCAAAMNLAVPDSISGAKPFEETFKLDEEIKR